jgi:hypothetical protein
MLPLLYSWNNIGRDVKVVFTAAISAALWIIRTPEPDKLSSAFATVVTPRQVWRGRSSDPARTRNRGTGSPALSASSLKLTLDNRRVSICGEAVTGASLASSGTPGEARNVRNKGSSPMITHEYRSGYRFTCSSSPCRTSIGERFVRTRLVTKREELTARPGPQMTSTSHPAAARDSGRRAIPTASILRATRTLCII